MYYNRFLRLNSACLFCFTLFFLAGAMLTMPGPAQAG